MIRLIEDLNNLVSSATDDVISSIADYVPAYEKILKAFAEGHDLTLYVRHADSNAMVFANVQSLS